MCDLKGKYILYIGLDYFSLPNEICKEIRRQGAKVDFFPIKKKSFFVTVVNRLYKALFIKIQVKYHIKILKSTKGNNYDYVLFIHVHQISEEILDKYKTQFAQAKFVLYYWDSIKQHNYLSYIKYFDSVFSFDRKDVIEHPEIKYLPLFYSKEFGLIGDKKAKEPKSVVFVGTYNKFIRYKYIKKFQILANKSNIKFYNYLSIKWTRYLRVVFEDKKILNPKYLTFVAPNKWKVIEIYSKCGYVLDVPNNTQSGLTMRVIESLGAKKFLITTNKNIQMEKIYDPKSIFIFDDENINKIIEFIKGTNPSYNNLFISNYSIQEWVKNLLI